MSHFYANIHGNRGPASRCGTKQSGHYGHIRGWHAGVVVSAYHNNETGLDEFEITMTGGSGYNGYPRTPLGTVKQTKDGPKWEPAK